MMPQIDIDFDVFKALTAKRASEATTYNDVIRVILGLQPHADATERNPSGGCVFKGVTFPDGTQFRATYKGQTYTAEIKGGRWVSSDGEARTSPSDAGAAITGRSTNGWYFWHAKRPGEPSFTRLQDL